MISSQVDRQVLTARGIPAGKNVGRFNPQRMIFLDYYQKEVFKK